MVDQDKRAEMPTEPKKMKLKFTPPKINVDHIKSGWYNITNTLENNINNKIVKKFKGFIIHAWISDFEDQYIKTFEPIMVNTNEPKDIINAVYKRMGNYDYSEKVLIIVKYDPTEKFSVIASQTPAEIENAEFQKWRKLKNRGKNNG